MERKVLVPEDIEADIKTLEKEIMNMLKEVME
jgi:hypothetical protein